MLTGTAQDWKEAVAELSSVFAERAAAYDRTDTFVAENYADMRAAKLFSAPVPEELGGGGVSYSEVCALIRGFGRACGSTALAFSMHQHLVAAALWNYCHGNRGEALLRAVSEGERVLVSTLALSCSIHRLFRTPRADPIFGCCWLYLPAGRRNPNALDNTRGRTREFLLGQQFGPARIHPLA